jgi:hypothetical protein
MDILLLPFATASTSFAKVRPEHIWQLGDARIPRCRETTPSEVLVCGKAGSDPRLLEAQVGIEVALCSTGARNEESRLGFLLPPPPRKHGPWEAASGAPGPL